MWVTDGGNNQTGFSNERYDELIDLAAKETDLEKRESYFIECEQIIADQLPIGPDVYKRQVSIWTLHAALRVTASII